MLVPYSLITLLVLALVFFVLAMEVGFRLGRRRTARTDDPERSHSNALQNATLGLLALLLGFTFAMSVERYNDRKIVIVAQANAISTAELRSRLLPPAQAQIAKRIFPAYVGAWLKYRAAVIDEKGLAAADAEASAIESQLWMLGQEAAAADPRSVPVGLYLAAMNDVIDSHEKRLHSVEDRVPEAVIFLLFGVSALALGQVAYGSGLSGRRWQNSNVLFAFIIALVLVIILDIDRPRRGAIQVSQESMVRVHNALTAGQ